MNDSPRLRLLNAVMADMRKQARPAKLVRLAEARLPALAVGAKVQADLVARMRTLRNGNYLHAWSPEIAANVRRVSTERRVFLLDWDVDGEPAFVVSRLALADVVKDNPLFMSRDGFVVTDLAVTRGMVVDANDNGTIAYKPFGTAAGPAGSVGFYDQ